MPTSTGYEVTTDSSYNWDGRRRGNSRFTVLQHTIAGAGNLRYENHTYRVQPGETMLVILPHNHRYWLEAGGRWEYFWISMHGEEALRIHEEILAVTGPILRLQSDTIDRLADCTLRLIDGGWERPGMASAISYEAAMVLYDQVFGARSTTTSERRVMQPVIEYINANLENNLPVELLADISGMSRAHFSRHFASSEGIPPAEFVQQQRLTRAVKLLAGNSVLSVKEIATLCGFAEPNYFAKVFRRTYGASPTEFRTSGMYLSTALNKADHQPS